MRTLRGALFGTKTMTNTTANTNTNTNTTRIHRAGSANSLSSGIDNIREVPNGIESCIEEPLTY